MTTLLLALIVLILLFGSGVVLGWLRGGLLLVVGCLCLLLALGYCKQRSDASAAAARRASLVVEADQQTKILISQRFGIPINRLIDLQTFGTGYYYFLCGTIAGTKGYGGPEGRRRFYSNGGGTTQLEAHTNITGFEALYISYCQDKDDTAM